MPEKRKSTGRTVTYVLCRTALLAALYFALKFVGINAGNIKINFATLPLTLAAFLFGAPEAAAVSVIGEFLNQLLTYGVMYSTVFWLVSPAVRALAIGLILHRLFAFPGGKNKAWHKRFSPLKIALIYAVCILASLAATLVNTGFIALDACINGYYTNAYVFGSLAVRLVTGVITAAVVTTAAIPLSLALKRALPGEMLAPWHTEKKQQRSYS